MFVLFGGPKDSREGFDAFKRELRKVHGDAIDCAMSDIGESDTPFVRIDGRPQLPGDPEMLKYEVEEGELARRSQEIVYGVLAILWATVPRVRSSDTVLIEALESRECLFQHLPFDHQLQVAA